MSNSTATVTSPGGDTSIVTTPGTTPGTTPTADTTVVRSTVIASSVQPSTQVFTSVITKSNSEGGTSLPPETVVVTSVSTPTDVYTPTDTSTSAFSTTTAVSSGQGKSSSNGGLSAGGKTAIAVVIPIVVIALLALAGIFLWRRRRQRKSEEELRKNEMEEYGYNPNHDPTLPAVAASDEIAQDTGGYRGWGGAAVGSTGRKTSTTHQLSDGGYHSPGSPTTGTMTSDHNSGDPLMRKTMDSDTMGALGAAPVANRGDNIRRGPSNASSSYSAGDHSNHSAEAPIPVNNPQDYYPENAYYQAGPYDNPYGGQQQPIIRDNPARRNTRIQEAPYPHQGTSGIAQNF